MKDDYARMVEIANEGSRELGFADQAMLRAAVATMKREHYTLRSLTQSIVASDAFRMK